eukprot:RCo034873
MRLLTATLVAAVLWTAVASAQGCNVVTVDDRTHGILLNFALTSPLMTHNTLPVYAALNPFSATNQTFPVLYMFFNNDLVGTGAVKGWSVAPVVTPADGPYVYYLAVGAYSTPYDPMITKSWVTGQLFTPGGAMQAVYAVGCSGLLTAAVPRAVSAREPSAVDSVQGCNVVTVDDRTHGILLNFALTSPLMTHNTLPVYAALNPFSATNQTFPVLYMFFNNDLVGTGAGWSVAPVVTPADGPYVYYLAVGAYSTPYDPMITKSWVTGQLFTPGGAMQAVYAVGCSGLLTAAVPRAVSAREPSAVDSVQGCNVVT